MGQDNNSKDLRQEQLPLLRFEKHLAGLAAGVVALPGVAAAANEKLGTQTVSPEAVEAWRQAVLDLAAKTQEIHSAVETEAMTQGMRLIGEATGGGGKPPHESIMGKVLLALGVS